MADKKKHTAAQLKAGPEGPLSSACLDLVTESFERNKVPRANAVAFQTLVVEGHVQTDMLTKLRSDAVPVLADSKVPKECKTQMKNALN